MQNNSQYQTSEDEAPLVLDYLDLLIGDISNLSTASQEEREQTKADILNIIDCSHKYSHFTEFANVVFDNIIASPHYTKEECKEIFAKLISTVQSNDLQDKIIKWAISNGYQHFVGNLGLSEETPEQLLKIIVKNIVETQGNLSIRNILATPNLAGILDKIISDALATKTEKQSVDFFYKVIQSPNTPSAILGRIYQELNNSLPLATVYFIKNPNTPSDVVESIFNDAERLGRTGVINAIMSHPNTSGDVLRRIFYLSSSNGISDETLQTIASHPNTPGDVLRRIFYLSSSNGISYEIFQTIASHPNAEESLLTTIFHETYNLFHTVIIDDGTRTTFERYINLIIRILSNPNITGEVLNGIYATCTKYYNSLTTGGNNAYLFCLYPIEVGIANNPSADPALLTSIVRFAISQITIKEIMDSTRTNSKQLLEIAAKNPNLNPETFLEILKYATKHSYPELFLKLSENPNDESKMYFFNTFSPNFVFSLDKITEKTKKIPYEIALYNLLSNSRNVPENAIVTLFTLLNNKVFKIPGNVPVDVKENLKESTKMAKTSIYNFFAQLENIPNGIKQTIESYINNPALDFKTKDELKFNFELLQKYGIKPNIDKRHPLTMLTYAKTICKVRENAIDYSRYQEVSGYAAAVLTHEVENVIRIRNSMTREK